jgi:hypothetical protein
MDLDHFFDFHALFAVLSFPIFYALFCYLLLWVGCASGAAGPVC